MTLRINPIVAETSAQPNIWGNLAKAVTQCRITAVEADDCAGNQSGIEKDDYEIVHKVKCKQNDISQCIIRGCSLVQYHTGVFTVPQRHCKAGKHDQAGKTAEQRKQQQFLIQYQHPKTLLRQFPSIGHSVEHDRSHQLIGKSLSIAVLLPSLLRNNDTNRNCG
jgi:hypothetical protein